MTHFNPGVNLYEDQARCLYVAGQRSAVVSHRSCCVNLGQDVQMHAAAGMEYEVTATACSWTASRQKAISES